MLLAAFCYHRYGNSNYYPQMFRLKLEVFEELIIHDMIAAYSFVHSFS